jgi:hypothetical protein
MYASEQLSALAQSIGVREVISKGVGGVGAIVRAIHDAAYPPQTLPDSKFQTSGEVGS